MQKVRVTIDMLTNGRVLSQMRTEDAEGMCYYKYAYKW